jgi:hypothetical protein
MPRNKSSQSSKTFPIKKSLSQTRQTNSNYQSLYLWVSFLWGIISLGMVGQRIGVQAQGLPATLDLATLTGTQGLILQGAVAQDSTGNSVSGAGDVNGDGKEDFLIGASSASRQNRTENGVAYLIYGSASLPAMLDLNALTATQGMVILGSAALDLTGFSVSSAGDVNGDGNSDILIGADNASPQGRHSAGAAYLIYGSATLPGILNLSVILAASQGMWIQGAAAYDSTGNSVSSAGDVNGDGKSDILVAARSAVYIIYGSASLPAALDLLTIKASQGVVIKGAASSGPIGSISGVEDVNGDGKSDILIGAYGASPKGRSSAGAAYLIYGSISFSAVLDLNSTLTTAQGMMVQGGAPDDYAGMLVCGAGDVNGDGFPDMLLGAVYASPFNRTSAGAAYLIYGKAAIKSTTQTTIGTLFTTTTATSATMLNTSTSSPTNSRGTTTSSTITTTPTTIAIGVMTGTTPTITSIVSTVGSSLSTGDTMTAASQTSSWLHRGSTMSSANSASSETLRGSSASTTMVTETPIQTISIGENSGVSSTVIGAAAGAGSFALLVSVAAAGFFACRKKSQSNNENGIALQDNNNLSEQQNSTVVPRTNYGKIDETKKIENEYDHPPQFMTHEQPNSAIASRTDYGKIDESKKTENEYDRPTKLEI